ncbi:hypothetical protein CUJ83_01160 [Methanocella sp. CWC-04]|uniref:Uncharacterized protein n=1 Tax=Methanooceanicella nereidis TaxID=2052831 RepID=A0AAP2W601_9EURY|nr:hypothetical protein [Methanocella sp. CWC-04]MCD1293606.1 hypothetical protein [Methanocella sp. CWC-04]
MSAFTRFMAVIIGIIILTILAVDYLAFHGDYLLSPATGGVAVSLLDSAATLFEGEGALYFTFLIVCMFIGVMAIMYKFVKG